jgi:hypothetical protein
MNRIATKFRELSGPFICQHSDTLCNLAEAPWPEITLLSVTSAALLTYKLRGRLRHIILNS